MYKQIIIRVIFFYVARIYMFVLNKLSESECSVAIIVGTLYNRSLWLPE